MNSFEIIDKLISVILSLLIFANAYLSKKIVGSWYNPSSLYSLFWFLFTFFPLIFLFVVPCNYFSLLYILFTCVFFSSSVFVFNWNGISKEKIVKSISYTTPFILRIFYSIMLLTFLFQIINLYINGFSISKIIFNFLESSAEYTSKRYSEDIQLNLFSQLSYVLCYAGVALGGLIYPQLKKNKITLLLFAFVPPLFLMLTQSAKGSFFLALFLFYGGIIVNKIFKNETKIFDTNTLKYIFKIILIILPLVIISFITRGFDENSDLSFLIERLIFSLSSYSFGHLYAFSDWFSFYIHQKSSINYVGEDQSYGFYTFMSIFKLFGSQKVIPLGTYDDYYVYKELFQTNIYSAYRGVIQDFTILGSLFFFDESIRKGKEWHFFDFKA